MQVQEIAKPIGAEGSTSFSLVPQNLEQAMKLADMIANSDLAPKDYKGKPGNVLIAVQMGQEIGLSPMTAIQNIAVINGKPGVYGDSGKALLLARGFIIEEDDIEIVKKNGMGRCRITRPNHPPVERTFSIENAKTAKLWGNDGPWTKYPERQMAWRAFWYAARDCAADVLKGMQGIEELRDITPVEREINPMGAREPAAVLPGFADDKFKKNLPTYQNTILAGTATAADVIARLSSKYTLTDEQIKAIESIKPADPAEGDKKPDATTGGKPRVTYAVVEERLRKAKSRDMLDAEADLIREVADETQQAELGVLYRELCNQFNPGK